MSYDHSPSHPAPDLSCSCGFYACPPDVETEYTGTHLVNLIVELSGTVIECETGFRAEHQRVLECHFRPCSYCGRPVDLTLFNAHTMRQAFCNFHQPTPSPGDVMVPISDLRNVIPVPVIVEGRR